MARLITALLTAGSVSACPLCHSDRGERLRALLFGPDFWFHLSVTILPFAIFLAIAAVLYYGPWGAEAS